MIVVTALGTALGIAARPSGYVHGVGRGALLREAIVEGLLGQQVPHRLRVDVSLAEDSIEATPTSPVGGSEAQVGW
jgi:hypothetical protein